MRLSLKPLLPRGLFGRAALMVLGALWGRPRFVKAWPLYIKQFYVVGVLSLLIIVVSGLFIGMVLALQGYTVLSKFGAEQMLGPLVALSLLRELGPVVTALLFAGRAGSALTAEIGLMTSSQRFPLAGSKIARRTVLPVLRFSSG